MDDKTVIGIAASGEERLVGDQLMRHQAAINLIKKHIGKDHKILLDLIDEVLAGDFDDN